MSSGESRSGDASDGRYAANKDIEHSLESLVDASFACVPDGNISEAPWLLFWRANRNLKSDLDGAMGQFDSAYKLFFINNDASGLFLTWASVVECILRQKSDLTRLDPWIEKFESLIQKHIEYPSKGIEARVISSLLGALMYRQPQHKDIELVAEHALTLIDPASDKTSQVRLCYHVVQHYLHTGNLARAELAIDALGSSINHDSLSEETISLWQSLEADFCRYIASPDTCNEYLDSLADEDDSQEEIINANFDLQVLFQHTALVSNTKNGSTDNLLNKRQPEYPDNQVDQAQYHRLQAWLNLWNNELPSAQQHAETALALSTRAGTPYFEAMGAVKLAQIHFEAGQERLARKQLSRAKDIGQSMNSQFLEYNCLITESYFVLQSGQFGRSLTILRKAIEVSKECGHMHILCYRPTFASQLFQAALSADIEVSHVQTLIRKYGLVPDAPPQEIENWPWAVKIKALGGFNITLNGEPLRQSRKPQQKPMEMLKVLIALGGKNVSQDELIDTLWPDAEGDDGAQSFATTLYRLRKLLQHKDAVELVDGRVSLSERLVWTDIWHFESLLSRVDSNKGQSDTPSSTHVHMVAKALRVYIGPFLGREFNSPWALSMQERLRSKFLRHATGLGKYWEQSGEWEKAIESYSMGLEVDDLVEPFYQRLMFCYGQLGRHPEAIMTYKRCCDILETILGIGPSADTKKLLASLRQQATAS